MEINKIKAQIGEILAEVERQKSLTTTESTKRINVEKKLSKWEELEAKVTEVKEVAIEKYKNLLEFHNEKVMFMEDAYIIDKDVIWEKIEAQHWEWDLSFLDEGEDENEDHPEDAPDAPTYDAPTTPPISDSPAPPVVDVLERDFCIFSFFL